MYGGRDLHNCKIIRQIQFVCWPLKRYINSRKYKMLCSGQLIANLCPFFNSIRLEHKTNTCLPFFLAAYENSEHVISMKNDDLPLSNMANTEMNVCYKILCAGYCSLVVTQENVFSRCTITSLCTDVPPPSKKNPEKSLSSRFFLREGGRLYTG